MPGSGISTGSRFSRQRRRAGPLRSLPLRQQLQWLVRLLELVPPVLDVEVVNDLSQSLQCTGSSASTAGASDALLEC